MNDLKKLGREARRIRDQVAAEAKRTAERAAAEAARIRDQAAENLRRAADQARAEADRNFERAKTNADHIVHRIERDAKNFYRFWTEDDCERKGRKEGPAAKKACLDKMKEPPPPPTPPPAQYYAALQIDCWEVNDGTREFWGTSKIESWSDESKIDAQNTALTKQNSMNGKVCAITWGYADLIDGESRWL